jgi:DNA repair photolyase
MEPRAATPPKRIAAIKALSEAKVPTVVMTAPIVPAVNDSEIENILEAAKQAGASEAGYVLLRLPLELKELFREWLRTEFPDRAARVINLLRSMHGGKDYTPEWGLRQSGQGPYASQIATRFRLAVKRLGLNERKHTLQTDLFRRPVGEGGQLELL